MTKDIEVLFLSESDCSSTGLTMKEVIKLNMIEKGCLLCSLGETNLDFQATKSMDKIIVDHLEQSMHMGELAKWVN